MTQLNSAFTLFLSLLVEAIPFLILGVLFSGILQYFISERWLLKWMPTNPLLGSFVGSCIGFLFPVCECGNVPVARRLLMQGVPSPVAIGFLLAAPTINPIVFWVTWTAFRGQPEIVFYRIGISLAIATIIGWVFSCQKDLRPFLRPNVSAAITARQKYLGNINESRSEVAGLQTDNQSSLLQSGTFFLGQSNKALPEDASGMQAAMLAMGGQRISRWQLLLDSMIQELRELAAVLVIGSAIAAGIQVFIPREVVISLGQGNISSIIAMMLLAALVSICSTVDSFFALSFASMFTTGSLIAFLVFGPMIDIKGVGLLSSVFQPRAIFYLLALAAAMTFLSALVLNFYIS
ncbi:permease [filamentous cyanobacterium LEGE 11480]|uniref:Permease n=1 Tax=Romeriopsis navalis LEGE 11480 TaxID=2777977 RepID=A0A928Z2E9_9CYAN|nr:permease [Romeriopsis navalis]MBE9028325.1 permease [Romeriopsis navalis LEGE 11480]